MPAGGTSEGRGSYLFFSKLVQSVWDDRNKYETILSLFGGEHLRSPNTYPPPLLIETPPLEHPTKPIADIDVEYLHGALNANSFGYSEETGGKGLYALPSLLNHSCLSSAQRTFLGDAIVIRASRDMKKGDEATVPYLLPSDPYDERRFRIMRSWRFKCTCALCEADSRDDVDARLKRRGMKKEINRSRAPWSTQWTERFSEAWRRTRKGYATIWGRRITVLIPPPRRGASNMSWRKRTGPTRL